MSQLKNRLVTSGLFYSLELTMGHWVMGQMVTKTWWAPWVMGQWG